VVRFFNNYWCALASLLWAKQKWSRGTAASMGTPLSGRCVVTGNDLGNIARGLDPAIRLINDVLSLRQQQQKEQLL